MRCSLTQRTGGGPTRVSAPASRCRVRHSSASAGATACRPSRAAACRRIGWCGGASRPRPLPSAMPLRQYLHHPVLLAECASGWISMRRRLVLCAGVERRGSRRTGSHEPSHHRPDPTLALGCSKTCAWAQQPSNGRPDIVKRPHAPLPSPPRHPPHLASSSPSSDGARTLSSACTATRR